MQSLAHIPLPRHGVLIQYLNLGIYLVGKSSVGKSETALELLDAGAQLVCDDAPLLYTANNRVIGRCPKQFYGLMHIRELGILDIVNIKSKQSVIDRHSIDLIIELVKPTAPDFSLAVTSPLIRYWCFNDILIPGFRLSCGNTRNIGLLVKTAILQYALG